MAEPTRDAGSRSIPSSDEIPAGAAFPWDVLLIADEPRLRRNGRSGHSVPAGTGALPKGQVEPLDMETVVRKLIALLSEESQP